MAVSMRAVGLFKMQQNRKRRPPNLAIQPSSLHQRQGEDHALSTPNICLIEEKENADLSISHLTYGSNDNAMKFVGEGGAKILLLAYPR